MQQKVNNEETEIRKINQIRICGKNIKEVETLGWKQTRE